MIEGHNVYCDNCWAKIVDAGYVDRSNLCADCRDYVDAVDELRRDEVPAFPHQGRRSR